MLLIWPCGNGIMTDLCTLMRYISHDSYDYTDGHNMIPISKAYHVGLSKHYGRRLSLPRKRFSFLVTASILDLTLSQFPAGGHSMKLILQVWPRWPFQLALFVHNPYRAANKQFTSSLHFPTTALTSAPYRDFRRFFVRCSATTYSRFFYAFSD